jgi:hypothetical protein
MRISNLGLILSLFLSPLAAAQVLSPLEMSNPAMRGLQQRYASELKGVASDLTQHKFPYAFYFSRKLDIEEHEQRQSDQRSIHFERYNNHTTLEIIGNYYAAYSGDRMDADHRLRQTFNDVILPILQVVVPKFESASEVEVFGVEVSHHVRKAVMGVKGEFPENVVMMIPRELAARIVHSPDPATRQNLMLDAEVYLSGQPTLLWLTGDRPVVADDLPPHPSNTKSERVNVSLKSQPAHAVQSEPARSTLTGAGLPTLASIAVPPELKSEPLHDATPRGLTALLEQNRDSIDKMAREQNASAHFVQYAPPAFIEFKKGAYLQLSMTTSLDAMATGSQYKLAALAFDRHIAHLIRPILAYFTATSGFDGIDFSTTVKIAGDEKGANTESVEFILPVPALRRYEQFDSTGQQLLNEGIVLINGERVSLDLQIAEAR